MCARMCQLHTRVCVCVCVQAPRQGDALPTSCIALAHTCLCFCTRQPAARVHLPWVTAPKLQHGAHEAQAHGSTPGPARPPLAPCAHGCCLLPAPAAQPRCSRHAWLQISPTAGGSSPLHSAASFHPSSSLKGHRRCPHHSCWTPVSTAAVGAGVQGCPQAKAPNRSRPQSGLGPLVGQVESRRQHKEIMQQACSRHAVTVQ